MQRPESIDVAALVRASAAGDQDAWDALVERFAHLVVAVTRRYRLSRDDAQDVSQTVWLRLVEHLDSLREPAALPGWIMTTARHECLRTLRVGGRTIPVDPQESRQLERSAPDDVDVELLEAERHQALRDGLAELSPPQRALLELLATDPPLSYAEVAQRLDIPVGSIGPTRARALEKLRATTAVTTYLQTSRDDAPTGGARHALAEVE